MLVQCASIHHTQFLESLQNKKITTGKRAINSSDLFFLQKQLVSVYEEEAGDAMLIVYAHVVNFSKCILIVVI